MKILFGLLTLLVFIPNFSFSQIYSNEDIEICNSKFDLAVNESITDLPLNEIIVKIGKSFLGTEYIAHTLEKEGPEQLVIDLSGLDCTTFLETSLALARCIRSGKMNFENYKNELTLIRYRKGLIDSYPSRLHYFSDWIYDNTQKGIIKDVTEELGGEKILFNVHYMSSNPENYTQLRKNEEFIHLIKKQEDEINSRAYHYIPKAKVKLIESDISTGDLIAITSSTKGLDINHVGVAVKMENGKIHFMHAPQKGTKVQITSETLSGYLNKIKGHTGIIVLRAI